MAKHSTRFYKTAVLSAAIAMLSACGGTTDADNEQQNQENIDPVIEVPTSEQPQTEQGHGDIQAEIVFPTPQADVGEGIAGDFVTVTVRVTSEQAATMVTANGIGFQRDRHDSQYWYGRVPVATGETELEVTLKDQTGKQTVLHQTLNNHRIDQISPISLRQTDDGRIYYLDHDLRLYQVHNGGGVEAVGDRSCWGRTMTLNAEQTKAYVLGSRLCEVDLFTKQTRFLYDVVPPSLDGTLAHELTSIFGMAASADGNAVFVSLARQNFETSTFGQFQILKIDVETQEVTDIPIQDPPTVYLFDHPPRLGVADAQTIYLFTSLIEQTDTQNNTQANTVFAIDFTSGEMRSVTAVDDLPRTPDALRLKADGNLEFVDVNEAVMAEVDLDSGTYQLVDEPSVSPIATVNRGVGSGPKVVAKGFALGEDGDYLYVTTEDGLYRIDLATGERFKVGDLDCALPCEIDLDGNTAYVLEQGAGDSMALMAMDIISGTKTLVSGEGQGTGGALFGGEGLALDKPNNRMFVATGWPFHGGESDQSADLGPVMEVDLATGNRRNAWYQRFDNPADHGFNRCVSATYGTMDVWIDDATQQLFTWGAHVDMLAIVDINEQTLDCRGAIDATGIGRYATPGYSSFTFDRVRQTAYFSNRAHLPLASADFSQFYSYLANPELADTEEPSLFFSPSLDRNAPLNNSDASGVELAQTLTHFRHDNSNVVIDEQNAIAYMNGEQGAIVALSLLTGDRVIISH